jgi:SAM-dependent methyltransferase
MKDKWEFRTALKMIRPGEKVLEIGAGQGDFIDKLKDKGIEAVGLEMGRQADNIINQSIEEHSKKNPSQYDTVCSFQVLEHVSDVASFISASINALKPGGSFILSVPNNWPNSPIFKDNILNMPPHHQGLWNINSLISLTKYFPLCLERLEIEPLESYHRVIFMNLLNQKLVRNNPLLSKIIFKIFKPVLRLAIARLSPNIIGHSILVKFVKK